MNVWVDAVVVDDLIDRVMTDARLNANPAVDEAHHKVPPAGFKYLVTEMVGWAVEPTAEKVDTSCLTRGFVYGMNWSEESAP